MDSVRLQKAQDQLRLQYLERVYQHATTLIITKCTNYCLTDPDETLKDSQKCCLAKCTDRYRDAHREVSEAVAMRLDERYASTFRNKSSESDDSEK